tara:strand:- start:1313 stop:2227 length:915 start_codon:yes stop_codon:yes gene_type:complete
VNLEEKISQGVSAIPLVVSVAVLLFGGTFGTWFVVNENIFYFAYDDSKGFLDGQAEYNYQLNHFSIDDVGGNYDIDYTADYCNCDSRADVFFNIKTILYAIIFSTLAGLAIVTIRNFDLLKDKGINKSDLVKYSLAAHILAVLLVLFLTLYMVVGLPGAMNADHSGTNKECLYGDDITIIGNSICIVDTVDDEAELHSEWYIGAAPIILLIGVMLPNIYLASELFEQVNFATSGGFKLDLYYDSEDKLLIDMSTGEMIRSFVDDKRNLVFDAQAKVLFDEDSGDIVYSSYFDKLISEKLSSKSD